MENNGLKTPEWLTGDVFVETLKDDIRLFKKILKFEVESAVGTGENYMTLLLRVLITVELTDGSSTQTSYMVKILPNSDHGDAVKTWKVFEKEKHTYGKCIPEFENLYRKAGHTSPRFGPNLVNVKHSAVPAEVLIMDDLRTKGFINVARQNGLDMAHTKCVLEKMAQFHAASAVHFEVNGPYPEMYMRCICSDVDDFVDYRANLSKMLLECLHLYVDVDISEMALKLKTYHSYVADQYMAMSPKNNNELYVLNHGDAWCNNIMFRHDQTGNILETVFVDMQLNRYGSPAQDLLYFLLSSTCLENKFQYFDYFIRYYHEKLVQNLKILNYGKPIPNLRELHISILRHGDWAYTIAVYLLPIVLFDSSDKANMDNVLGDTDEANELKKAMFCNTRYVDHMKQFLPWMCNRGLLNHIDN